MNALESLARLLPRSPDVQKLLDQQIEAQARDGSALPTVLGGDYNGRRNPNQTAELSTVLAGLPPEQEQLIWCKYLSDGQACRKGLNSYRAQLYKEQRLLDWVFIRGQVEDLTEKLSQRHQREIDMRTSVSAVLSGSAYTDMISSFRCDVCSGVGATRIGSADIKCEECSGRGHCGTRTTAQMRADKLHCSLSSYYRKYHPAFEELFWSTLMEIETRAIMHVQEQFNRG